MTTEISGLDGVALPAIASESGRDRGALRAVMSAKYALRPGRTTLADAVAYAPDPGRGPNCLHRTTFLVVTGAEEEPQAAGGLRNRGRALGALRTAIGLLLFAAVLVAVVRAWADVRDALSRISPLDLALSQAFVLGGLAASAMTWRASLREVGFETTGPRAAKIYLLGQLAKYLPGSVWVLPAQMELARRVGVPRARGLAASVVTIGLNMVTGLIVGLILVPTAIRDPVLSSLSIVALASIGAVVLSPPVLTRIVDLGLRLVGRPQLERRMSWRGVLSATTWSLLSWTSYGVSVWLLAVGVGAPAGRSLVLSVAGAALAITVGTIAFVAPSGIGVRDAVVASALAGVVDSGTALAIALIARLLFTVGDLLAASVVLPVRLRPPGPD